MEMPLELEFKNMTASPALEAVIREKVAKLERFHDRITGCRVTVEEPHRHQHQGKQYQVHIRLMVPGAVLVSSHDAGDKGHDDPNVAVRDAFDAMRRQLEDHVRIHRGEVKKHTGPRG
ncbi:MAG: ribosome-associated translation inhibitor RaiA [Nevskia sp.]|nr:ribosome-associated translation inhibitor RaiA [Nevskia sp.]